MGGWKTKNWHDNRESLANPCHLCWAVGWFVSWPFKLFHTYLQVVKNRVLLRPPFSSHKLHQTDLHTAAKTARDWFESLFGFFLFWQGVGPAGVQFFFFGGCLLYISMIHFEFSWLTSRFLANQHGESPRVFSFRFPGCFGYRFRCMMSSTNNFRALHTDPS